MYRNFIISMVGALIVNFPCVSAFEFTSEPVTNTAEFVSYLYTISTDANEAEVVNYSCLKKPSWLDFELGDNNLAYLGGMPVYNIDSGGDSVVLSATLGDTTIWQKFLIWVDWPPYLPSIWGWPDTYVHIAQEYDDTILMQVFFPEALQMEILEAPSWLDIYETPSNEDITKLFRLNGIPENVAVGDSFPVHLEFTYGSYISYYWEYFHVVPPDQINFHQNSYMITLFPNPARNSISFQGLTENSIEQYSIYSLSGNLIDSEIHGSTLYFIDLPSGIYILIIRTSKGELQQFKFCTQ